MCSEIFTGKYFLVENLTALVCKYKRCEGKQSVIFGRRVAKDIPYESKHKGR
jgi:hypothetical protein